MNIYDMLKSMSDEEIEKYVSYEILNLERKSRNNNSCNTIGYKLDYNFSKVNILHKDGRVPIEENCCYMGYIPKGVNVVFGCTVAENGMAANSGMYYTVDTDSYIYDFCKYIKNIDVINERDLFEYVLLFIKDYFGTISNNNRIEMFRLISKLDGTYYKPVSEHKFSDFKGKGNAMCTEYAITANNILSILGFDSYVVFGQEKNGESVPEDHAFNLVSYTDSNYKRVDLLIDFADYIHVFDERHKKIGDSPYVIYLNDFDLEFINDFFSDNLSIKENDYFLMTMGNQLFTVYIDKDRQYYVSSKPSVKTVSKIKQK